MTRLAITVALAVITPVRRGLTWVEGRLVYARYRLRDAGALFVVLALVAACGLERHVRSALDVAATAVDQTDDQVDDVYTTRSTELLEVAETIDEYRESMRPFDAIEAALRVSRSALLAAESGLDAHGTEGILPTLGCVALALERLSVALVGAGIDVPPKISRALDAISGVTGATCSTEVER